MIQLQSQDKVEFIFSFWSERIAFFIIVCNAYQILSAAVRRRFISSQDISLTFFNLIDGDEYYTILLVNVVFSTIRGKR